MMDPDKTPPYQPSPPNDIIPEDVVTELFLGGSNDSNNKNSTRQRRRRRGEGSGGGREEQGGYQQQEQHYTFSPLHHTPLHQTTLPTSIEEFLHKCRTLHSTTIYFLRAWGCSDYEMRSAEGPNGNYYRDDFNDESWTCTPGTGEENGIWINTADKAGLVMGFMVWCLLAYSALTIALLAKSGGIPAWISLVYSVLCNLALASHAKTTLTDPGSVPQSAVPQSSRRMGEKQLCMCSQCQTFKPPFSHHCRICNRCISRMDHHCPWMNNCIGAGNIKHFILFLMYTWSCSALSILLLLFSYFFTSTTTTPSTVLTQLLRLMSPLSVAAFLFTSSMLMNVCYGLMTGIGTIDRLKKKATDTMGLSEEEPVPLESVFGIAGFHTWWVPVDPVFEDYDSVMGYSTPQRLLREEMREEKGEYASSIVGMDLWC